MVLLHAIYGQPLFSMHTLSDCRVYGVSAVCLLQETALTALMPSCRGNSHPDVGRWSALWLFKSKHLQRHSHPYKRWTCDVTAGRLRAPEPSARAPKRGFGGTAAGSSDGKGRRRKNKAPRQPKSSYDLAMEVLCLSLV